MQYYVGEDDDRHLVDHPPLFACECEGRKTLLKLNESFIQELVATAQDIMPGNLSEIAGVYFKPAEMIFTLPEFLIPPKIVLYNPDNYTGPDALPYLVVLVDKRFFGIPAAYLTPDRFSGCDSLKDMKVRPRRRSNSASTGQGQQRRSQSQSQGGGGKPRGGKPPQKGGKPRRPPQGGGKGGKGGPKRPPRQGQGQGRPDQSRRPGGPRPRRPDESGAREGARRPRPR